jgi:hypothetical protein
VADTPMPAGVFPELDDPTLPERFDPATECMICFGPLGFRLIQGAAADACQGCTVFLTGAKGVTATHLRRYIVSLALFYGFPLPTPVVHPCRASD